MSGLDDFQARDQKLFLESRKRTPSMGEKKIVCCVGQVTRISSVFETKTTERRVSEEAEICLNRVMFFVWTRKVT